MHVHWDATVTSSPHQGLTDRHRSESPQPATHLHHIARAAGSTGAAPTRLVPPAGAPTRAAAQQVAAGICTGCCWEQLQQLEPAPLDVCSGGPGGGGGGGTTGPRRVGGPGCCGGGGGGSSATWGVDDACTSDRASGGGGSSGTGRVEHTCAINGGSGGGSGSGSRGGDRAFSGHCPSGGGGGGGIAPGAEEGTPVGRCSGV